MNMQLTQRSIVVCLSDQPPIYSMYRPSFRCIAFSRLSQLNAEMNDVSSSYKAVEKNVRVRSRSLEYYEERSLLPKRFLSPKRSKIQTRYGCKYLIITVGKDLTTTTQKYTNTRVFHPTCVLSKTYNKI